MAMKKGSIKGRVGSAISLAEEDRRYLSKSLGEAAERGIESGAEGMSAVFEALERFGLSSDRVQKLRGALGDVDVRESVEKAAEYLSEQIENARDYAKRNPKKVIGGAAGVLVGASLLAIAIRRAGGEEKRKSSSKKSPSSGSSKKASSGSKKSSGARKSSGGSKKTSRSR